MPRRAKLLRSKPYQSSTMPRRYARSGHEKRRAPRPERGHAAAPCDEGLALTMSAPAGIRVPTGPCGREPAVLTIRPPAFSPVSYSPSRFDLLNLPGNSPAVNAAGRLPGPALRDDLSPKFVPEAARNSVTRDARLAYVPPRSKSARRRTPCTTAMHAGGSASGGAVVLVQDPARFSTIAIGRADERRTFHAEARRN